MSEGQGRGEEAARRRRARTRRALDDVFGDALPSVTQDEAGDDADGRRPRASSDATADERDDEIRRDVPPHHS